ncbi:MAG: RDD family protein [Bacteriovoracaceae bacterium]|nr:RDD family protein [Bacteriovoracaceae bacterium]
MGKSSDSDYLKFKGQYPKSSKIFTAMFVDLIVVNIIAIIVLKVYGLIFSDVFDKFVYGYVGFAIYLVCLLYVPILSAKSQTLGQRFTHIKIRNVLTGENMSVGVAITRWLMSVISPFGYNHKKVPWFDRKFDTVMLEA